MQDKTPKQNRLLKPKLQFFENVLTEIRYLKHNCVYNPYQPQSRRSKLEKLLAKIIAFCLFVVKTLFAQMISLSLNPVFQLSKYIIVCSI